MLSAWFALIAVQLLYGVAHVFSFELMRQLDPYVWTLLRALLSWTLIRAIFMWRPPSAAERSKEPPLRTLMWVALLGVTLTWLLFLIGLAHSSPTETGLVIACTPVWTYIFACLLRHERVRLWQAVGIVWAAAGILVLRYRPGSQVNYAILINSVVYGAYLAFAWPHMRGLRPVHLMTRLFDVGTVFLLPLIAGAWLLGWVNTASVTVLSQGALWWNIAFLVLFATIGTYTLNSYAARKLPASVVAVAVTLQPLVAAITDHLVTGRRYDSSLFFSALLIVPGVLLTARARR